MNLPVHVARRQPAVVVDLRPVEYERVRMHHGPELRWVLAVFLLALSGAGFAGLVLALVT